jgi:hypothetical protein
LWQPAKPALLGEHGLQHREHRLGGIGGGGIADEIGQLIAASVNRAHVTAKVVHEDFGRIRAALRHRLVFVVTLVFVVHHAVHETLHDADVFGIGHAFHHFLSHADLLKKSLAWGLLAGRPLRLLCWPTAEGALLRTAGGTLLRSAKHPL